MSQKPKKNLIFLTLPNLSAKFNLLTSLLNLFPFPQMQNQENKQNHPYMLNEVQAQPSWLQQILTAFIIRKVKQSNLPPMKSTKIIWKISALSLKYIGSQLSTVY